MSSVKESNFLQKRNRMSCFNHNTIFYTKLESRYFCQDLNFFIGAFLFKVPFMLSTKVNICETQTSPSYQTASENKKCLGLESKEEFLCTFKEL